MINVSRMKAMVQKLCGFCRFSCGSKKDRKGVFYGRNRVYCAGRCVAGPQVGTPIATVLIIIIPFIALSIWTIPWYIERSIWIVPVLLGISFVGSMLFFFLTACSDPGVVPRQKDTLNSYDHFTRSFRVYRPPRFQEIVVNGQPVQVKYCSTCHIYRPPRSVHCSICDNCVERFDHHCPWVGTCIGVRNYKSFFLFVLFCAVLTIGALIAALAKMIIVITSNRSEDLSFLDILWRNAGDGVVLFIYTFIAMWYILGLLIFHSYLVAKNLTTYEHIRKHFFEESNPFDRGICGNFGDILCRKTRARYLNWRAPTLPKIFEPVDHVDPSTFYDVQEEKLDEKKPEDAGNASSNKASYPSLVHHEHIHPLSHTVNMPVSDFDDNSLYLEEETVAEESPEVITVPVTENCVANLPEIIEEESMHVGAAASYSDQNVTMIQYRRSNSEHLL